MSTFYARLGDITVELTARLADDTGNANLTNATSIAFHAFKPGATTPTINGTAAKDADQTTNPGKVTYTLTAANLAAPTTAGRYEVVWVVTWTDASKDSFPRPGRDVLNIDAAG